MAFIRSDDGSQDSTLDILNRFGLETNRIRIFQGPENGFCQNFLSLICNDPIEADYYALSDQDDIWHEDKLARAVATLSNISREIPALYCSRTKLVDERNLEMGLSPLFRRTTGFRNALVQNIAGGNTMVFNHAARKLIRKAGLNINPLYMTGFFIWLLAVVAVL